MRSRARAKMPLKKQQMKRVIICVPSEQETSQSQPLPSEKQSTPEFKSALKVSDAQVRNIKKSLYRIKGSNRPRIRSKKRRVGSTELTERERQVVEEYRLKMIAEADLSTWTEKQAPAYSQEIYTSFQIGINYNMVEDGEVLSDTSTARDFDMKSNIDVDEPIVQITSPAIAPVDYDSTEDIFGEEEYTSDANVLCRNEDSSNLELRLSQLNTFVSPKGTIPPTPEIGCMTPAGCDDFYFYEGELFHRLPKMRKPCPRSDKTTRQRVQNIRNHLRVLATGGTALELEDEEAIDYQISLIDELRQQVRREQTHKVDSDDAGRASAIEVTTALVAVSFPSLNKLSHANKILGLAGYAQFSSDRQVKRRLDENMKNVEFICDVLYVNDEPVNMTKVVNVKDAIAAYLQATASSLDMNNGERRMLMLRIGIDRGGLKTKLAISFANRTEAINSPYNWFLLGIYDSKDNSVMLRAILSSIFQELDVLRLSDLSLPEELASRYNELAKILIGDMPSMAAVMGIKSHASNFPCVMCTTPKESLQTASTARNYTDVEEKVAKGKESHNFLPLLKDVHTTVPLLHAFQGPATTIFYRLQEDILKAVLGRLRGVPPARWFDDAVKLRTQQDVRDDLTVIKECGRLIEKIVKGVSTILKSSDDCGQWCGQRKQKGPVCWKKCSCGQVYHAACIGLMPSYQDLQDLCDSRDNGKDVATVAAELETCPTCADPHQQMQIIKVRLEDATQVLNKEFANLTLVKSVERGNGVLLSWGSTCKRFNVLPGRFHGGALTGNHSRNFLKNSFDFLDVLDDVDGAQERVKQLKKIIDPLKKLHDLTESRYLSDEEIASIPALQDTLKAAILEARFMRFTPKVHMICCHLAEIAIKFRSIGINTEQGLEHLHGLYTKEEQNFKQFKEPKRSLATALRLNALNMERLNNELCQKLYGKVRRGKVSSVDSDPDEDTDEN